MKTLKTTFVLLALLTLSACGYVSAKTGKAQCTRDTCTMDPTCQCWCSVKCGFRDKKPNDNPMWVENDPNGKYCYCKQWDLDNYKARCIEGKNIPQPAGAQ